MVAQANNIADSGVDNQCIFWPNLNTDSEKSVQIESEYAQALTFIISVMNPEIFLHKNK